jgi:hypothetical protein
MPCVGFEPTIPASEREDSSCLRPPGYCDRHFYILLRRNSIFKGLETEYEHVTVYVIKM